MSTLDATRPSSPPNSASMVAGRRWLQSRWLWCLAAVAFVLSRDLLQGVSGLLQALGDTDDATRLYQVRAFMDGASWFDMSLPRLGGPTPLLSHWSRLIDLPLALLLSGFGLVMSAASAELVTRIVWPALVLLLLTRVMVREAEAQGGIVAAGLILFFIATTMTGLYQFRMGRIDHHNGMILGAVGGLLVMLRVRLEPRQGFVAGALIGLGLAIGYEPLALVLPAIAGAALYAVFDVRCLSGMRNTAIALAATLGVIFVATVPPSLWLVAHCDALSLNMVLLATAGAVGLDVVNRHGRVWTVGRRIGVMAAVGAVGLATYGALDPRCFAGPFGQVDRAVFPIWLDHVSETLSALSFFQLSPTAIVTFCAAVAAGAVAALERWRRLRTPESAALLVLMLIAMPPSLLMVKLSPYASFIAAFCIVLSISDLKPRANLSALSWQLIAAMFTNQVAFAAIATPMLMVSGVDPAMKIDETNLGGGCMTTPAIRSLAPLPKGLFAGSIDFGAFIVALTDHDALSAPYHRIDKAILTNSRILNSKPAEALRLLKATGVDYVVLCMPKPGDTDFLAREPWPLEKDGIEVGLKSGKTFDFLTPVVVNTPVPELRVWRVVR